MNQNVETWMLDVSDFYFAFKMPHHNFVFLAVLPSLGPVASGSFQESGGPNINPNE